MEKNFLKIQTTNVYNPWSVKIAIFTTLKNTIFLKANFSITELFAKQTKSIKEFNKAHNHLVSEKNLNTKEYLNNLQETRAKENQRKMTIVLLGPKASEIKL